MPNLLSGLKDTIHELLDPGYKQKMGEAEYLRELYSERNAAGGTRPNTWYRLHNSNGDAVGFSYVCNCSREWQLISAFEWVRAYECGVCHAKFNLYLHAGITDASGKFKVDVQEIEPLLAKLPVRLRLTGRPSQNFVDTWPADVPEDAAEERRRMRWN